MLRPKAVSRHYLRAQLPTCTTIRARCRSPSSYQEATLCTLERQRQQIPIIYLHVALSEATSVPTWTDAAQAADILGQDTDGTVALTDPHGPIDTGACPADTSEFDGER